MPKFSSKSIELVEQCHPDLQLILYRAIEIYDFSVVCGHRNKKDQNKAFVDGFSKSKWPHSNHNIKPSNAFDAVPYPIDWDDINKFYQLNGVFRACADQLVIPIRWGGDFKDFFDGAHYERVI